MKKRLLIIPLLAIVALTAWADETLSSPDGKIVFTFHQTDDRLLYSVVHEGETIVSGGQLGVNIDNHLVESAMGIVGDTARIWTSHMTLVAVDRTAVDTTWTPLYGEQSSIRDHYNQLTLHFRKGTGNEDISDSYDRRQEYLFDIIVRAYDEGIALRYFFPEASNGLFMHITDELTSFRLPEGATAWHEAWAQGPYNRVALTGDAEAADEGRLLKTDGGVWRNTSERPLLMQLPTGKYVALLEAGMSDFARGKIALASNNKLKMSLDGTVDIITPYASPWRVVMVADKAVDLINNKQILLCLNDPCQISDTDFIRPGRAFRAGRLNNEYIHKAIDFAADFGIEYVELDAGWYGKEMEVASSALAVSPERDFSMAELCQYAKDKGVGIWVYVNQRALYNQLDSILPLYRQWGIKGIKFGFVQIGSQMWTTWLHDAVKRCAEYGLMVDIHDEYRPTGWSRTYPNLMTQEGIMGNEEMPDATHNVTLPFTRFLCGPGDYTLCYYKSGVKNTKAHQLAMAAVYYSPVQFLFWYDIVPFEVGEELDFWKQCPTVWDESRALYGEPGEWICQARRSGDEWYVGIMTNTEERDVEINTADFLSPDEAYELTIYEDDPTLNTKTKVAVRRIKVERNRPQSISLHLQPSGGAAIRAVSIVQ